MLTEATRGRGSASARAAPSASRMPRIPAFAFNRSASEFKRDPAKGRDPRRAVIENLFVMLIQPIFDPGMELEILRDIVGARQRQERVAAQIDEGRIEGERAEAAARYAEILVAA